MTGRWQYRLRGAAEEPINSKSRGSATLGLPPEHPILPSLLRSSAVFDAVSDFRKPMDLSLWLGVNRSHAQRHGEDLQRRDGGKDAV